MDIGIRVRAERKALGLSQEALARIAGVSLTMLNRLERGAIDDPHISTLASIAGALNVSLLNLVEGRVEEEPSPKATAPPEEEIPSDERRSLEDLTPVFEVFLRDVDELVDVIRGDLLPEALDDIRSELEHTRDPAYRMMLTNMLDRGLATFRVKATRVEYTREARAPGVDDTDLGAEAG